MGFGWSFYGFFIAAAVWLVLYFVWAFKAAARDRVAICSMTDSPILLVVAVVYLAVILGVSIWGYFHTKTEEEFLAAGRSIGPWVGGAVLAATQISAGTFVGTLGRHYLTGVSWIWIWFGVWTGWVISAIFVAPKLRRFGALTVADYVGKRFASEGARTLAAALIILTYTILLTAQFQAIGEIASAIFGIAPTGRDGRAAGEHRLLHRARRRPLQLVHRLRADADHGAGAAAAPCRSSSRTPAA